jgi:hypothetical protein
MKLQMKIDLPVATAAEIKSMGICATALGLELSCTQCTLCDITNTAAKCAAIGLYASLPHGVPSRINRGEWAANDSYD